MKKDRPDIAFRNDEARRPSLFVALDDDRLREFIERQAADDHAKLLLLCEHHGIKPSPSMYYELALALARELYPEPKKRGRRSKWTDLNRGTLVVEVERIAKPDDPSYGVAWACQQLAKREPWLSFLETAESGCSSPDPAEALRRVYYDSKDARWTNLTRDVFALHQARGTVDEWADLVDDCVRNPHPK